MREKLIELLRIEPRCPESVKSCVDCFYHVMAMPGHCDEAAVTADMLIANDVIPVVRCKDCKHLVLTDEGEHDPNDCVCDYWMTDGLNDFDFCYYGERKDNG